MRYDCFTFFNEHELLELRLRLLDDVVDRFILVESDTTHQGQSKPLHFELSRDRYQPWLHKIVHVAVRDMPNTTDAWDRERYQRRAISRGLSQACPEDLIIISDLDEIPRPEIVAWLDQHVDAAVSLDMSMHNFKVNLEAPTRWGHARAVRHRHLKDPQALREAAMLPSVPNSGWHFSYVADDAGVQRKLAAFAHSELATEQITSETHIRQCMDLGVDLFGRFVYRFTDENQLPSVLKEPRYRRLFHPGRGPYGLLRAHLYRLEVSGRRRFPSLLGDRQTVFVLPVSLALAGVRAIRRVARILHT